MEYMVRPENTARLTVNHKPTMFTYKDLQDEKRLVITLKGSQSQKQTEWHYRKAHILACLNVLQEM